MNGTEERLVRVENDIKELRSDVAGIKASLGHMATKEDLAELKVSVSQEISEFKGSMSEDMAEFKASMSQEMSGFKASMSQEMSEFKTSMSQEMSEFKASMSQEMASLSQEMSEFKVSLSQDVAEIKGSFQHLATKEDFANARHDVTKAKLAMVTSMLAAAVAVGAVAAKFVGLN